MLTFKKSPLPVQVPVDVLKTQIIARTDEKTRVIFDYQLSMIEVERDNRSVYTQFINDRVTISDFAHYVAKVRAHFQN